MQRRVMEQRGTHFFCGDGGEERLVLYADSEGGAALIAISLEFGSGADVVLLANRRQTRPCLRQLAAGQS